AISNFFIPAFLWQCSSWPRKREIPNPFGSTSRACLSKSWTMRERASISRELIQISLRLSELLRSIVVCATTKQSRSFVLSRSLARPHGERREAADSHSGRAPRMRGRGAQDHVLEQEVRHHSDTLAFVVSRPPGTSLK